MNRLCEKCRVEFRDKGNVDHMLESSVKRNHPRCVDLFIAAGASVNSYHHPVRICCEEGYDKCLKLLVEAGARVNERYKRGTTALILAAEYSHVKCVKLLM